MKTKRQTPTAPEQYPDTYVFKSIKHKRLSPEQEAEARKKADEYFRKQGWLGPELRPDEKLELEARPSLSELTELAKQRERISDLRAFPLPDIYDADDPRLPRDAFSAIREYRLFLSDVRYMSELARYMKEQLCAATDVALDIRSAFPELREVRVAKNPDSPTKEDFINLEQWFLDAYTFEQAEIEQVTRKYRESPADATQGKPDGGGDKKPKRRTKDEKIALICAYLKTHPKAQSPEIKAATGIDESDVRRLWKRPRQFLTEGKRTKQRGSKSEGRTEQVDESASCQICAVPLSHAFDCPLCEDVITGECKTCHYTNTHPKEACP